MPLSPRAYRLLLRPLLFRLPPETAQSLADLALQQRWLWRMAAPPADPRLKTTLAGLDLPNPIGLAAGYDKDCRLLSPLADLGFGYVTGGTITANPRSGNPRPRVLRDVRREALINSLGFPGKGLDHVCRRLEESRGSTMAPTVVSVSGTTVEDILLCHRRVEPLADAVEINISSPNTAGLRVFQEADALGELLGRVNERREKPLFVKMPPYGRPLHSRGSVVDRVPETGHDASSPPPEIEKIVRTCVSEGVDALTVANTHPVEDARLAVGSGGLSGKPVFQETLRMVRELRGEAGPDIAINACGGISTGADAWEALRAGATTVQLLTGLIYRGPGAVRSILRDLLTRMDAPPLPPRTGED